MDVAAQLAEIRERADAAARRVGRDPREVEVMVVSKTFPAEVVCEAVDAGQVLFGENRTAPEPQSPAFFAPEIRWI